MEHVAGVSTIPPHMYTHGAETLLKVCNSRLAQQRFDLFNRSRFTMTGVHRIYEGLGCIDHPKHLRERHGACRRGQHQTPTPERSVSQPLYPHLPLYTKHRGTSLVTNTHPPGITKSP